MPWGYVLSKVRASLLGTGLATLGVESGRRKVKYRPTEVKANFINSDEDWALLKITGAWTLVTPKFDKRSWKPTSKGTGIAFKDTATMQRVAEQLIFMAKLQDELDAAEKSGHAAKGEEKK